MGKKSKGKDKGKAARKARKKAAVAAAAGVAGASPVVEGIATATTTAAPDHELSERGADDATELAARLASLGTVLQRHLSRADPGDGLTRARLSALALLVLGGPRTLGDLAAAERVRPPTMTRLIQAMEADRLVVRERNPDDGRSIIIRATRAGERLLKVGRSRQIAPLAETIAHLDETERRQLDDAADLLGRVLRDSDHELSAAPE